MSRTITLMSASKYRELVDRYADSFRGQSHSVIRSRYRACSIAVSRALSRDCDMRMRETRELKAHMDAMEDAAPIVLD